MTAKELEKAQLSLEDRIFEIARENGMIKTYPITDGVYDAAKYLASGRRVMWVMKEPYDEIFNGEPYGGGWNLARDCFAKPDAWSNRSWQPIIYTMYGLKHGLLWSQMDWIRNNKSMADILQEIAYINVSKMPNMTASNNDYIRDCYQKWKPILFEQLDLYDPEIIIFANTFLHFEKDLRPDLTRVGDVSFINVKSGDAYRWRGKLLLDVYHPNQRTVTREVYVNSIIQAADKYVVDKNK